MSNMTREQAARILHPDTTGSAYDAMIIPAGEDGGVAWRKAVDEACLMGAEALQPWVRTADRAPDELDEPIVLSCNWDGRWLVALARTVIRCPNEYHWWMPIPPLPEVDG